MSRRLQIVLFVAGAAACRPVETHLCAPCSLDVCSEGLQCRQNVCVPPDAPQICANYVPPAACGDHPPCGEGLECFEGECHAPLDVEVGWSHACVLWRSGTVACWGANYHGQCGVLDKAVVPGAERAVGITNAVELAAGIGFTCARLANGDVKCWGSEGDVRAGHFGHLGNFGAEGPVQARSGPHPQSVALSGPARRIWSAEHRSCAELEDGSLECWGADDDGCLNAEDGTDLPVRVASGAGEQVSLGEKHTVWVKNGLAIGYGKNDDGQLGVPTTCEPTNLGFQNVTHVAAGVLHTCVVIGGTRVECIGRYRGIGRYDHPVPIAKLVAARKNTCLIDQEGTVACWGPDDGGFLGTLDYFADPGGPEEPIVLGEASGARDLAIGHEMGCLVRDGDGTYCWGQPDHGGYIGDGIGPHREPKPVASGDFVALEPNCALARDGAVTCWGGNGGGWLGRGFVSVAEDAAAIEDFDAVSISSGGGHSCAIRENGEVWCWGRIDSSFQTVDFGPRPSRLAGVPPAVAVSNGWSTICVLTETRDVYCLGENGAGQAVPPGAGGEVLRAPTLVPGASGAIDVAVGNSETCARYPGDRVKCWGRTLVSALALGGDGMVVPGVRSLRGGNGRMFLTLEDGTLLAAGSNEGMLGDGGYRRPETLVEVVGATDTTSVGTYFQRSCLTQRGEVWCWGVPFDVGPPQREPVRRAGLGPADLVSVTRDGACALLASNEIWCWGSGAFLGRDDAAYLDPVFVAGLVGRGGVD